MSEQETLQETPTEAQPSTVTGPISPYTPPSHGKRIVFILLILLVISGGLVVGTIYIAQVKSLPIIGTLSQISKTSATPTALPKAEVAQPTVQPSWKSVSNSMCGVTVSYPPDWGIVLNSESNTECSVILTHATGEAASRFIITGVRSASGWETVKKDLKTLTPTNFAGIEAYSLAIPQPTEYVGVADMKNIIAWKNGIVYQVVLLNYKNEPEMQAVLEQIKETVRISDKPGIAQGKSAENQFAEANNSKRESAVLQILNAIGQYTAENRGVLPLGIPSVPTEIAKDGYDLCHYIYPGYTAQLPQDPLIGNGILACNQAYKTGFMISKSSRNEVTISAPRAELGKTISVTR